VSTLAHVLGLPALAILAWGLLAIIFGWRPSEHWWFRPGVIVAGAISAGALFYLASREIHFILIAYLMAIATFLITHGILAVAALAMTDWRRTPEERKAQLHPTLKRAIVLERSLDFAGAVAAYDEYLEEAPDDAAARARLAEALIRAGNAKRAISVLTVAFTQAEEPKRKIAIGIRLAEVIFVAERNPLGARSQLEQVKKLFAGTGHEKYVEALSQKLIKRVAEGRYLKTRPEKPKF